MCSAVCEKAQQILHGRGSGPGHEHKNHRSRHPYGLKGPVCCALCHRRMQGRRSHGEAYYRRRYAQEYALANKIDHPRNVYLRERDLVTPLDHALASAFTPGRIEDTITRLTDSQHPPATDDHTTRQPTPRSPPATRNWPATAPPSTPAPTHVVTAWITETQK